jgi:hypothetical protein
MDVAAAVPRTNNVIKKKNLNVYSIFTHSPIESSISGIVVLVIF